MKSLTQGSPNLAICQQIIKPSEVLDYKAATGSSRWYEKLGALAPCALVVLSSKNIHDLNLGEEKYRS